MIITYSTKKQTFLQFQTYILFQILVGLTENYSSKTIFLLFNPSQSSFWSTRLPFQAKFMAMKKLKFAWKNSIWLLKCHLVPDTFIKVRKHTRLPTDSSYTFLTDWMFDRHLSIEPSFNKLQWFLNHFLKSWMMGTGVLDRIMSIRISTKVKSLGISSLWK